MTKLIPLTKGHHAIVDDEDYDFLMQWRWIYKFGYAIRRQTIKYGPEDLRRCGTSKRWTIVMHRVITGADEHYVDHRDGDRLNNTRANLRLCNQTQNLGNQGKRNMPTTSKYKGVSWNKTIGKWRAGIRFTVLGWFTDETEAARAYDTAARVVFGEFARLNFPEE